MRREWVLGIHLISGAALHEQLIVVYSDRLKDCSYVARLALGVGESRNLGKILLDDICTKSNFALELVTFLPCSRGEALESRPPSPAST